MWGTYIKIGLVIKNVYTLAKPNGGTFHLLYHLFLKIKWETIDHVSLYIN